MLEMPPTTVTELSDAQNEDVEVLPSRLAAVKNLQDRIKNSKLHWENDFQRMQSNMDFTAGIQWDGQEGINTGRYVANITLQIVNQKEASLYARNPTVVAKRRPRMDFQIWDERNESLMLAQQTMQQASLMAQQNPMAGLMLQANPQVAQANALLMDFQQGMQTRTQMERCGKTLEILYKYFCDCMSPDFKCQMKSLVRRASICNVAYVRQEFIREYDQVIPTGTSDSIKDTMQQASLLMKKFQAGEFGEDDAQMETLQNCLASILSYNQAQSQIQSQTYTEKLIFLFPKSRSIIPDRKCTDIVGFINADEVTEEHIWPLSYVNQYFEKNIQAGGEVKEFEEHATVVVKNDAMPSVKKKDPDLTVWETYNRVTKTKCWTCNGYKDYLQEPEPIEPLTKHFWPWFGIVLNKVEVDESTKATAMGPSDVQQMKHPQREWNRTREGLKDHRKMSAPQMFAKKGVLTETDKTNLKSATTGDWIELEALQNGDKISDVIGSKPTTPIEIAVYDTTPLMLDTQMTTGQQETNIGASASRKNQTATAAAIAEQSKQTNSSSNVDDLDTLLTQLAENGAELLFYECQIETVKRIAGPGAVWPVTPQARKEFADNIYLEVQAASSGRPNQQLEVSNFERLAPIITQMTMGNPMALQFLLREGVKRLGDSVDLAELANIPIGNVSPQQPMQPDQQAAQSQQRPQQNNPLQAPPQGLPPVGPAAYMGQQPQMGVQTQ